MSVWYRQQQAYPGRVQRRGVSRGTIGLPPKIFGFMVIRFNRSISLIRFPLPGCDNTRIGVGPARQRAPVPLEEWRAGSWRLQNREISQVITALFEDQGSLRARRTSDAVVGMDQCLLASLSPNLPPLRQRAMMEVQAEGSSLSCSGSIGVKGSSCTIDPVKFGPLSS